jgi:hypothetical protein
VWFRRRSRELVVDESHKALVEAEAAHLEVQKQGNEITNLARALRDIRERNHFAEQLEEIIVKKRGGYSR